MKNLNSSVIELTLIVRDQNQNMSNLQFNFTCVEFIPTQVVLQLNFENPTHVSFNMIDTLEVKILHSEVFTNSARKKTRSRRRLAEGFLFVPKNYTTHHKLPQQIDPILGKRYQKAVETAQQAVNKFTMVTIVINFSLGMSLYFLWGLINALQMMIYNPLANIRFPINVMWLYGILIPISSLDIVPPELSTDLVFTMSSEDSPYSNTLEHMGYETHNFIYNLGTMFWII